LKGHGRAQISSELLSVFEGGEETCESIAIQLSEPIRATNWPPTPNDLFEDFVGWRIAELMRKQRNHSRGPNRETV
jgi:hypothetical protein